MDTTKRMRLFRYAFVALLLCVVIASWWYASVFYRDHREGIWLQVDEIAETITLPYKIARLNAEDPVTAIEVPVHGILLREIQDTWGEARSEGRTHEGVDIFARRGDPVYAAARGYVIRVGENDLGGNVVLTLGSGGIRYYYAHLDRVAEGIEFGMPVTKDTVLGFVGNTGNASGTPPHLHFGIYTNGPQNPYPLLVERE